MEHLVFSNYIGYKSSKIANFVQVELRPKQEYGVFTFYARLTFASMGKSSLPALDIKGRERAERGQRAGSYTLTSLPFHNAEVWLPI